MNTYHISKFCVRYLNLYHNSVYWLMFFPMFVWWIWKIKNYVIKTLWLWAKCDQQESGMLSILDNCWLSSCSKTCMDPLVFQFSKTTCFHWHGRCKAKEGSNGKMYWPLYLHLSQDYFSLILLFPDLVSPHTSRPWADLPTLFLKLFYKRRFNWKIK